MPDVRNTVLELVLALQKSNVKLLASVEEFLPKEETLFSLLLSSSTGGKSGSKTFSSSSSSSPAFNTPPSRTHSRHGSTIPSTSANGSFQTNGEQSERALQPSELRKSLVQGKAWDETPPPHRHRQPPSPSSSSPPADASFSDIPLGEDSPNPHKGRESEHQLQRIENTKPKPFPALDIPELGTPQGNRRQGKRQGTHDEDGWEDLTDMIDTERTKNENSNEEEEGLSESLHMGDFIELPLPPDEADLERLGRKMSEPKGSRGGRMGYKTSTSYDAVISSTSPAVMDGMDDAIMRPSLVKRGVSLSHPVPDPPTLSRTTSEVSDKRQAKVDRLKGEWGDQSVSTANSSSTSSSSATKKVVSVSSSSSAPPGGSRECEWWVRLLSTNPKKAKSLVRQRRLNALSRSYFWRAVMEVAKEEPNTGTRNKFVNILN